MVGDYVATQVNTSTCVFWMPRANDGWFVTSVLGRCLCLPILAVCGACTPDSIASSTWRIEIHLTRRVAVPAAESPLGVNTAMNEGQVNMALLPGNTTLWEGECPPHPHVCSVLSMSATTTPIKLRQP
jgi:hypothetical protein